MRHRAWKKPRLVFVLAAIALLGLGPRTLVMTEAAEGQENARRQKPRQVLPTGREDAVPPGAQQLVAEETLEQMLSRSTEGLEVVYHLDGTMSVDLENRFLNVAVAAPGPDGRPGVACLTGRDALAALRGSSPATAAPNASAVLAAATEPKTAPAKLEERN